MKPVYKIPSHSTEEPKSIVFDFQVMGKVRVVFYGDNHKSDAEEFCALYRGFDDGSKTEKPI